MSKIVNNIKMKYNKVEVCRLADLLLRDKEYVYLAVRDSEMSAVRTRDGATALRER